MSVTFYSSCKNCKADPILYEGQETIQLRCWSCGARGPEVTYEFVEGHADGLSDLGIDDEFLAKCEKLAIQGWERIHSTRFPSLIDMLKDE